MADNLELNAGEGGASLLTREVSHAGDTAQLQGVFMFGVSGTEGAYTIAAINGDATNGLDVDVTRVPAVSLTGSAKTLLETINSALAGTLTVDGSAVTQPVSGTVTVTGAVAISLSHSVVISNTVNTEVVGDVSLTGSFSFVLSGALPAGTNNIGTVSLSGSTSALVQGMAAHDAAVSGNPVLTGLEARTTRPTAVGDGDAVRAMADDLGRQVVVPNAPRDLVGHYFGSLSVSTTSTFLPAGGAGVLRDILSFTISNPSSASEAVVTLYSSLTTGSVMFKWTLAPGGGGVVMSFPTPFPAPAANTILGITSSVTGLTFTVQYADNA